MEDRQDVIRRLDHLGYLILDILIFLANVRMLKFGSELRYGIRSPNVRTPVDIPSNYIVNTFRNSKTSFEPPPHEKTNNVAYEQIRHKPTCTITDDD